MNNEALQVAVLRSIVADLPADRRIRVQQAADAIRRIVADYERDGLMALALVGAETAAGTAPTNTSAVTKSGAERITAERQRQIDIECWTPAHDAQHPHGDLIAAAVAYADTALVQVRTGIGGQPLPPCYMHNKWPWARLWWKPSPVVIKNLVRAGALLAAEIDRLLAAGEGSK